VLVFNAFATERTVRVGPCRHRCKLLSGPAISGCRWCLTVLLVAAAGCTEQPPPRPAPAGSTPVQPRATGAAEAVVELTPAAALERARVALVDRGFAISALPGPGSSLEANHPAQASIDWATCPRITVRDPFSEALRSNWVNAVEVATQVTVNATPASASSARVAVRSLSIGTYVNSYTGNPQEGACRSNGVLEQDLLAALQKG